MFAIMSFRYIERFFSLYFAITGVKKIVRYTRTSLYRGSTYCTEPTVVSAALRDPQKVSLYREGIKKGDLNLKSIGIVFLLFFFVCWFVVFIVSCLNKN